jgi:hypothetical protein
MQLRLSQTHFSRSRISCHIVELNIPITQPLAAAGNGTEARRVDALCSCMQGVVMPSWAMSSYLESAASASSNKDSISGSPRISVPASLMRSRFFRALRISPIVFVLSIACANSSFASDSLPANAKKWARSYIVRWSAPLLSIASAERLSAMGNRRLLLSLPQLLPRIVRRHRMFNRQ